jgi:uncharacterized membrane protein
MSGSRLPRMIFFAIIVIAFGQSAYNFPLLPDRLASHFNAYGAPNGWMAKQAFFIVYAVMILVAAIPEFFVPYSIARTPNARVNLPNKDYWLAPAQRAGTMEYFEKSFAWFGCALLLLEVCAMGLAIQANFNSPPRLPAVPMLSLVVAFLVYTIVWVVLMMRRFSIIPTSP